MTAQDQQPHPWNCRTCKTKPCPAHAIVTKGPHSNKFGYNYWIEKSTLVTSIVGCASHHLARQIDPAPNRHQQCLNCCFVNSRGCTYHGYPDDKIPVYCMYKIGTAAFEAQENLQGTFIEWQHLKEHDAAIAAAARAEGAREERERVALVIDGAIILCDEVENWIDRGYPDRNVYCDEMREHIRTTRKALRSQQPGGEDGGAGK